MGQPGVSAAADGTSAQPLLQVQGLAKHFAVTQRGGSRRALLKAVDGISFTLDRGQSLGLAGESGCGKTTTGRVLLRLLPPTAGSVVFDGHDTAGMQTRPELLAFRRQAQLVFQNPYEALNPRFTIERSLMEPLMIHGIGSREQQRARARQILERVHLHPADAYLSKLPHQLSGGQLQRIVLARALVLEPLFLVADEPVSMLDVSVRAGVLNLMKELRHEFHLSTLYISHDLALIGYMCEQVAIMYLGRIVEMGPTRQVIEGPRHPYAQALISTVPVPDPEARREVMEISGEVPSPVDLPAGCRFRNRCPFAQKICAEQEPELRPVAPGHFAACHFA